MRKLYVFVGVLVASLVAAEATGAPPRPYLTATAFQNYILVNGYNFFAPGLAVTVVAWGKGGRVIATGQAKPAPPCSKGTPASRCSAGWFAVRLQQKSNPCGYYGNATGAGSDVIKLGVSNVPGVAPIHVTSSCGGW